MTRTLCPDRELIPYIDLRRPRTHRNSAKRFNMKVIYCTFCQTYRPKAGPYCCKRDFMIRVIKAERKAALRKRTKLNQNKPLDGRRRIQVPTTTVDQPSMDADHFPEQHPEPTGMQIRAFDKEFAEAV